MLAFARAGVTIHQLGHPFNRQVLHVPGPYQI
jgi:hypothetical protein